MATQIFDIPQGDDEWHQVRSGKVTASVMQTLLVNGKGEHGFGAGAFTLMDTLIGEQMTGEPAGKWEGNDATRRGHVMEPMARGLYEQHQGLDEGAVSECGFMLNDDNIGYSPDGLVDDDGIIEIKSKLPRILIGVILDGTVPNEHMAQCQTGLLVSDRQYCDFIAYWPGMPLFVRRVYRDEAMIANIRQRVALFYQVMERRIETIMNASRG